MSRGIRVCAFLLLCPSLPSYPLSLCRFFPSSFPLASTSSVSQLLVFHLKPVVIFAPYTSLGCPLLDLDSSLLCLDFVFLLGSPALTLLSFLMEALVVEPPTFPGVPSVSPPFSTLFLPGAAAEVPKRAHRLL